MTTSTACPPAIARLRFASSATALGMVAVPPQSLMLKSSPTRSWIAQVAAPVMSVPRSEQHAQQVRLAGRLGRSKPKIAAMLFSKLAQRSAERLSPQTFRSLVRIVCEIRGSIQQCCALQFLEEQCILQFPARSHAFSCPVCVKHSLVPPHSFVPCDKNPHSANALHFLCTCSSNVHNLQTSCFTSEPCLLYCDLSEYSKWMRRCLRPVNGLLPPAGERGCCLRYTDDF